jgi:hypothetical protein
MLAMPSKERKYQQEKYHREIKAHCAFAKAESLYVNLKKNQANHS